MRPLLGLLAFPLLGFLWAFPYLFVVGRVLGRGDLALVGALVTLPLFTLVVGVAWIVAVAAIEGLRKVHLAGRTRVLLAGLIALGVGVGLSGLRGFTLAPGAELFNWAILLPALNGALLYLALNRPAGSHAASGGRPPDGASSGPAESRPHL